MLFSVKRTDGSPTGPDTENRVGDQDIGGPGRAVLCKNKTPMVKFPRRFSFKSPSIAPAEMSNTAR